MHTTARLGLEVLDGTDDVSTTPTLDAQAKGILDNAVTVTEGTLVSRPAGSYAGQTYYATDTGVWYFYTGSAWQTVAMPGGPYGPLAPVSVTANMTAQAGQLVVVSGSSNVTVTAPASVEGAIFGVINVGSGVTTVSGPAISGVGLAAAPSFPLGTPGAKAVLLGHAAGWYVIDGEQDSGWTTLSLVNGATVYASETPKYRIRGNVVRLRGAVNTPASGGTFATLPANASPVAPQFALSAYTTNSVPVALQVGPGTLGAGLNSGSSYTIWLDGCTYPLD